MIVNSNSSGIFRSTIELYKVCITGIADAIRNELGVQIKQIDLDFNTDPSYPSNKLLSASAGYISSMGFQSQAKPGLLMAAWAADVLCH